MAWNVAALRIGTVKAVTVTAGFPGLRGGPDFQRTGAPSAPNTGLPPWVRQAGAADPRSFYWTRGPGSRWGGGHKWVGGGRLDLLEASLCPLVGGFPALLGERILPPRLFLGLKRRPVAGVEASRGAGTEAWTPGSCGCLCGRSARRSEAKPVPSVPDHLGLKSSSAPASGAWGKSRRGPAPQSAHLYGGVTSTPAHRRLAPAGWWMRVRAALRPRLPRRHVRLQLPAQQLL